MVVVDVYIAISLVGWLVGSVCQTDRHTKRVREREREREREEKERAEHKYMSAANVRKVAPLPVKVCLSNTQTHVYIYTHIYFNTARTCSTATSEFPAVPSTV